jgi:hypothetical protein
VRKEYQSALLRCIFGNPFRSVALFLLAGKPVAGQQPRIRDYLVIAPEEMASLFRELLAIELELRRKHGEAIAPEEYLRQFPEYADQFEQWLHAQKEETNTEHVCSASVSSSRFFRAARTLR